MAEHVEPTPEVGGFLHPLSKLRGPEGDGAAAPLDVRPAVRRIELADLRAALDAGWQDFSAHRADVVLLCVLYPAVGLILSRAAYGADFLPLVFPLAAGFALLGPLAATGLYEMNRRMEAGEQVNWLTAFAILRARSFTAVVVLGLVFGLLLVVWLRLAALIYEAYFGAAAPHSLATFLAGVFGTANGWRMIVTGDLVGLCFAVVALVVGTFSFPMLIDGRHGRTTGERISLAVGTSLAAARANPVPLAAWGLIVAAGLVLGSIPLFLGLLIVLPVLGHATWHLYRRVVA